MPWDESYGSIDWLSGHSVKSGYETDDDFRKKKVCECGALKVYGKNCTGLHHALYCPLRKDVEDE